MARRIAAAGPGSAAGSRAGSRPGARSAGEPVRRVSDAERRARIGVRHGLADVHRRSGVEDVAAAMTVLHATDPGTIHLSCWARMPRVELTDVDRALEVDRTLVRQLSMRRTLFAVPRGLLPAVWGSASARVARSLRGTLLRELDQSGPLGPGHGSRWLDTACAAVLAHLSDARQVSTSQLVNEVPEVAGSVTRNPGTRWGGRFPLAPRVLALLHLETLVSRARNDAAWPRSRPLWASTASWLGQVADPLPAREGYAEVVRRWLWSFGPGTVEDVQWWLGATKASVRQALSDVEAVPVALDDGTVGWLRPDDVDSVAPPDHWVALLPVLDPTIMGWAARDFYLGLHRASVFDTVGNAGATAWVDGRVVGAWAQDVHGVVRLGLLDDVPGSARTALITEAERLTGWLGGVRAFPVNPAARAVEGLTAGRAGGQPPT